MTLNKIFSAIHDLDVRELTQLNTAIITEIKHKQKQIARLYKVGDHVEFTHSKTGVDYSGQVIKVSRVHVTMLTQQGQRWRVSPSLLRTPVSKVA